MEEIKEMTEANFRRLAEDKGWDKDSIDSFIAGEKKFAADLMKAGLNASLEVGLLGLYDSLIKDGPPQVESYPL